MTNNSNKTKSIVEFIGFLLSKPRSALALLGLFVWLTVTLLLAFYRPTFDPGASKPSVMTVKYWLEGWWQYNDDPPSIKEVDFVDEQHGWVVGDGGTILVTIDGGQNWTEQNSPSKEWLNSVDFLDEQHGWAVGSSGGILVTVDGGQNWSEQNSKSGEILRSVEFLDEQHGWALGERGKILVTVDGGQNWTEQNSSSTEWLYKVDFIDEQHGWALGEDGTILVTVDGGRNWTEQKKTSKKQLNSVDFIDEKHGWVVGDGGTILVTVDGGQNWSEQNSPSREWLYSVDFLDAQHGWAVGDSGTILVTVDGGQNWSEQSPPSTDWLYSVDFLDEQHGWAVGSQGTILATTDGGKTWQVYSIHRFNKNKVFTGEYWSLSLIVAAVFIFGLFRVRTPAQSDAISAMLSSDRPRGGRDSDALNAKALAWALSRFLRHERTQPPLTIALNAPWGGGKSSLMNWLREDLVRFGFRPAWFNAWHYEKQEQMFPALLETIRRQAVPPWFSWSGLGFRSRLLWHRAKSNLALTIILLMFAFFPIGYVSVTPSLFMNKVSGQFLTSLEQSFPKYAARANSPQQTAQTTKENKPQADKPQSNGKQDKEKADKEDKLAWLLGLFPGLAPLLGLWKGLQSFSRPGTWIGRWLNASEQSKASGETAYRAQFAKDFNAVTTALDRTLVIFIDDLDRCQPKNVCEVMETINFLASEGSCHVILGIWREGVERAVGLGFAEAAKEFADIGKLKTGGNDLDEAEIRRRYGQLYLEKLVNIWVSVPSLDADAALRLLKREGVIESSETSTTKSRSIKNYVERVKSNCKEYVETWSKWRESITKKSTYQTFWRNLNWIKAIAWLWRFIVVLIGQVILGSIFGFVSFVVLKGSLFGDWLFPIIGDIANIIIHLIGEFFSFIAFTLLLGFLAKLSFFSLRRAIAKYLPDSPPSKTGVINILAVMLVVTVGYSLFCLGSDWASKPNLQNQVILEKNSTDIPEQNIDNVLLATTPTQVKKTDVKTNELESIRHSMIFSELDARELIPQELAMFVAILIIWVEWLKSRMDWPSDSPAFEESLQFWSPVLCKRFDTPRQFKRFLNHLRFNAMRLRTLEKPDRTRWEEFWNRYIRGEVTDQIKEDEIQGKESGLLLLSVLEACCGTDFKTKSMLVLPETGDKKSFQPEWEKTIKIDAQLIAENGRTWGDDLVTVLIERLRYFEKNAMPQPTLHDLIKFEKLVPARITPLSVKSTSLSEHFKWDGKLERRKTTQRRKSADLTNVTAERRTGLDRRRNS
ncbi:MAG: YCF48-related protein [Gammaproteobacteria bacterium]